MSTINQLHLQLYHARKLRSLINYNHRMHSNAQHICLFLESALKVEIAMLEDDEKPKKQMKKIKQLQITIPRSVDSELIMENRDKINELVAAWNKLRKTHDSG